MIRVGRLFEPETTRIDRARRSRFRIQCSRCQKEETIECGSKLPDDLTVAARFRKKGWLTAKTREHDICPYCLKIGPENRMAEKYRVTKNGEPVPSPVEVADRAGKAIEKKIEETRAIVARHIGGDLPTEKAPSSPAPKNKPPTAASLRAMAAQDITEIKGLMADMKAALELITDSNAQRTNWTRQIYEQNMQRDELLAKQAETTAHLVGVVERNNALVDQLIRTTATNSTLVSRVPETIAAASRDIIGAIRAHAESRLSDIETAFSKAEAAAVVNRQDSRPDEAPPANADDLIPAFLRAPPSPAPPKQTKAPASPAQQTADAVKRRVGKMPAQVSVRSIPDKKYPAMYHSMISIERGVWDESGIREDERVHLELDNKAKKIVVRRATEGGIKIKSVGPKVVSLQTTRLGDINIKKSAISVAKGEIRICK